MIAQHYVDMLGGKSVIASWPNGAPPAGLKIGYENVFDYSLGNPSVPCPPQFTAAMLRLLQTQEPVALHGYSPTLTIPSCARRWPKTSTRASAWTTRPVMFS